MKDYQKEHKLFYKDSLVIQSLISKSINDRMNIKSIKKKVAKKNQSSTTHKRQSDKDSQEFAGFASDDEV